MRLYDVDSVGQHHATGTGSTGRNDGQDGGQNRSVDACSGPPQPRQLAVEAPEHQNRGRTRSEAATGQSADVLAGLVPHTVNRKPQENPELPQAASTFSQSICILPSTSQCS